jgi:hypothetical protein
MDELYRLSLVEAARRLASGEMTSEVYARGLLLRARSGRRIHAWAWLEPEAVARARTDAAARQGARGRCTACGRREGHRQHPYATVGSPIYRG